MKQLHVKHGLAPDPDKPGVPLHQYTVKKVVNSTTPEIDAVLDTNALRTYCKREGWTVTVT